MWTKSEHQRELDNNSINPPATLVKGVAGDSRHYWDALGDPPLLCFVPAGDFFLCDGVL